MVTREREPGFAIGNFDTSFATDERFRRMREDLAFLEYHAAASMYWHLVAASWREARRVSIHSEFSAPPAELVAALQKYGLIDHHFRIRRAAFDHYIGKAIRNRAQARDRQRRHRDPSRTKLIPDDSPHVIPVRKSRVTARDSSKQEGDTDKTNVFPETDEKQDDARAPDVDTWLAIATAVEELTGRPYALPSPHAGLGKVALELARLKGLDVTLGAFHRAALMVDGGHPDAGQVVLGASNLLRPIPGSHVAGGQNGDRGHTRPVKEVASAFNRD